ncbi:MAG: T9SS type A sorting domain-containing protein [Bacteroidia bacterium]
MNIKRVLVLATILIGSFESYSQCGTDDYVNSLIGDPEVEATQAHFQKLRDIGYIEERGEGLQKKAVRVIPVVFHIIHDYGPSNISKEQIEDALRILNEDFSRTNADTTDTDPLFLGVADDMEIEFRLARKDKQGNCTEGITRWYSPELTDGGDVGNPEPIKQFVRWDWQMYLNIWVIERIGLNWSPTSRVLGYSIIPRWTTAARDGVVMRSDMIGSIGTGSATNQGRVLTHEVGHWLGLRHPFNAPSGGSGCFQGDDVADTPPVAYSNSGCPSGQLNSCSNDNPDLPDMLDNYMDYTNGRCQNTFTTGQKDKIQREAFNSLIRTNNYSAGNLSKTGVNTNPSCGPIADFWIDDSDTVVCVGSSTVKFKDWSYNGDITTRKWVFEGGFPSESSGSNPSVQYNASGVYSVKLIVENAQGIDSLERKAFIRVLPNVADKKAPFPETFEDANFDAGWSLGKIDGYGWTRRVNIASTGSYSAECEINSNTTNGDRFAMTLPPIDVSLHGSPLRINFDHAYSRRISNATEVLLVMVSDDCGQSWNTVRGMTASNGLASINGNNPGWFPTQSSDWAHASLDISQYANSTNLIIRFDVISKEGNSVFIDNINVAQFGLGTDDIRVQDRLVLYPNPAEDELSVEVDENWIDASLEIKDLSGRLLLQSEISNSVLTFSLADLPNGVYLVQMIKQGVRRTERLIINR